MTAKARRRQFTAEYKRKVLAEAEACTRPGEIGALLRREGLYSSHLVEWRRGRDSGALAGFAPRKRGPAGCLDRVVYPTGTVVEADCDTAQRPIAMRVNGSPLLGAVTYHPSGQPVRYTYGNGVHTEVLHDDRGRTMAISSQAVNLRYTYDGADNVLSFDNLSVHGSRRTMKYDRLDRLVEVDHATRGTAAYQYDALGNRTWAQAGSSPIRFAYDERNRIEFGSRELRPTSFTFEWDEANRLVRSSDGASYRYDGHDRRIAKNDGQVIVYHHDAAGRVIAETLVDGRRLREYFYLGNRLVAVHGCMEGASSSGCTQGQWYHTDTLGSALARTDATGSVVARLDYDGWGEQVSATGVTGVRQYNGRVYDEGTGLHDYGARMYWPEIGRFVSADTYGGDPANPASLNRYSYVHNNPYKYTDPTGKWGRSVHYTATREWAVGAGFSPGQAEALAQANNGTDEGATGPFPITGTQSRHFNAESVGDSRMNWFNAEFEQAVNAGTLAALYRLMSQDHPNESFAEEIDFWEQEAMSSLGRALHSLQDIDAHSPGFQKKRAGVYYHDDPNTDREDRRPGAFEHTRQATEDALRRYKERVESRVQNGNGH